MSENGTDRSSGLTQGDSSEFERRKCEHGDCTRPATLSAVIGVQDGDETEKAVCGTCANELERGPKHILLSQLSVNERNVETESDRNV